MRMQKSNALWSPSGIHAYSTAPMCVAISAAGLFIDTHKVLNDVEWFGKAVSKLITFEVSSWSDVTDRFR